MRVEKDVGSGNQQQATIIYPAPAALDRALRGDTEHTPRNRTRGDVWGEGLSCANGHWPSFSVRTSPRPHGPLPS